MKPQFLISMLVLCAATAALRASDAARVPFPADYAATFTIVRAANKTGQTLLGTIYANAAAAGVTELPGLPYPAGAVFVMEWAKPLRNEKGELLTDEHGLWRKGEVVRIDVMQRGPGYGEGYGEQRAGEWEFATYRPNATLRLVPADAASCAACHRSAGSARDFVFRGRFPKLEGAPE